VRYFLSALAAGLAITATFLCADYVRGQSVPCDQARYFLTPSEFDGALHSDSSDRVDLLGSADHSLSNSGHGAYFTGSISDGAPVLLTSTSGNAPSDNFRLSGSAANAGYNIAPEGANSNALGNGMGFACQQNGGAIDNSLPFTCCDCSAVGQSCDDGLRHGLYTFVGYEAFRGISDGGWENNGINAGVNFGTRLGVLSDWTGIGFQIGGSVGAYDWSGTDYRLQGENRAQTQGFVTYGFFRKASEDSPWNAAIVQDWMINDNYGVFGENPTLSQLRMQVGYDWSDWTEFGLWGTVRVLDDSRQVVGFGNVTWRPIDQLSGYWHHLWTTGGADTTIWFGIPERDRLGGNGSLGDYFVGAITTAPLNDRLSLYTVITYMHPSATPGPAGSNEDFWDFTIGLAFYPRCNARNRTIAGQQWMPALPVANNGTFLVDANQTF